MVCAVNEDVWSSARKITSERSREVEIIPFGKQ